jgi:predicted Rossmann fold nucleotide-binding protein DprA/Smf involved in DNA uptake
MNSWGIAVVGSRDASDEDNSFAQAIGQDAASQGIILISGGARGIDRSAMLGALAAEGVAVGVLADNLLRFATSSMYRKHLADNRLALISPYNPETDFRTANAMERNKYIYCLSQAAIVVSSSLGTGGTWAGALENIKRGWVPLWVRASTDPSSGNNEIIKRGGLALSERPMLLRLLAPPQGDPAESHILPSNAPKSEAGLPNQLSESYASPYMPEIENKSSLGSLFSGSDTGKQLSGQLFDKKTDIERSLFETFLDKLAALTKDKPLSAAEVAAELDMIKAQASAWLKRALEKQLVKKSGRPSRYQVISGQSPQPSLFDTR